MLWQDKALMTCLPDGVYRTIGTAVNFLIRQHSLPVQGWGD